MKASIKKKPNAPSQIKVGDFTKRQAVVEISNGKHHIHSAQLKEKDALVRQTQKYFQSKVIPVYSWESSKGAKTLVITSSSDRSSTIKKAMSVAGLLSKRALREKAEGILEELITNGIYHAYRDSKGIEKYSRSKAVELTPSEELKITFHHQAGGLYLSIEDKGGSLTHERISTALSRCYGHQSTQIESKEGGAGLGLYLIFEAVTHLKIVTARGVSTKISCWIADQSAFDPGVFSFNYFEIEES